MIGPAVTLVIGGSLALVIGGSLASDRGITSPSDRASSDPSDRGITSLVIGGSLVTNSKITIVNNRKVQGTYDAHARGFYEGGCIRPCGRVRIETRRRDDEMTRKVAAPIGQAWPIVDNANTQLRPPAAAGGPYEHRFVDGACSVCGYAEGAGDNGCPWNVGTVFANVAAARRAR